VAAGKKAVSLSPRDPSIGVFYWMIGRAYFIEGDYEETAIWLGKSVEERPNLWFSRAWLISAYSLTGRDEEARAALVDFKQNYPTYTLPRITEVYTEERQFYTIRAATERLFEGLKKAGLQ
jgi:hypothetical protein